MDIKKVLSEVVASKKFEGVIIDCSADKNSRLNLTVQIKGSVDLPGDMDQVVAQMINLFGMGNSQKSIESSQD